MISRKRSKRLPVLGLVQGKHSLRVSLLGKLGLHLVAHVLGRAGAENYAGGLLQFLKPVIKSIVILIGHDLFSLSIICTGCFVELIYEILHLGHQGAVLRSLLSGRNYIEHV